jgi:hypothetical protein
MCVITLYLRHDILVMTFFPMFPLPVKDSESAISHSTEYWFSDGSIILLAESTLFRVHLSVLARHSEIFTDPSLIPQPAGEQPKDKVIEGCPVIRISDSAKDIAILLSLLYDPVK